MAPAPAVATAVTFVWLGMVLAISFLEAPLRFRAPEVSLRVGLGIGRLVFRALNTVEAVLALALLAATILASAPARVVLATVVVVAVLAVQLAAVRRLKHLLGPILIRGGTPQAAGSDPDHLSGSTASSPLLSRSR